MQTPPASPSAILKHTLKDGSWHLDWLLSTHEPSTDPDRHDVPTFRIDPQQAAPLIQILTDPKRAPSKPALVIAAQRLPDHRRHYLTHEGPVRDDGSMGTVHRIAEGQCFIHMQSPTNWLIDCSLTTINTDVTAHQNPQHQPPTIHTHWSAISHHNTASQQPSHTWTFTLLKLYVSPT